MVAILSCPAVLSCIVVFFVANARVRCGSNRCSSMDASKPKERVVPDWVNQWIITTFVGTSRSCTYTHVGLGVSHAAFVYLPSGD